MLVAVNTNPTQSGCRVRQFGMSDHLDNLDQPANRIKQIRACKKQALISEVWDTDGKIATIR